MTESEELERVNTKQQIHIDRALQHYELTTKHIANNQYNDAVVCLNKAIILHADNAAFYTMCAECFVHLCDFQSAILNYRKACLLQPANDDHVHRLAFIYYLQAQCLSDQKLFLEALENYSRASELNPAVDGYYIGSIVCLATLGFHSDCLSLVNQRIHHYQHQHQQQSEGISDAIQSAQIEAYLADLLTLRARVHLALRQTSECYSDVLSALSVDANHCEAKSLQQSLDTATSQLKQDAVHLSLLGRHQQAINKLNTALATNAALPEIHIQRGSTFRRLGDFNAAIDDFLVAMAAAENNIGSELYRAAHHQLLLTYNDFAVECINKQFYDEALLLLNKAIKDDKSLKGLYLNRAECFYRRDELQFALADFEQVLELDSQDTTARTRIADVQHDLAKSLVDTNNLQEAERRLTLAVEFNSLAGHSYLLRAKIRQIQNRLNEARHDVVAALLLESENPEVMPMMTRLFPGKTVSDILDSELATQTKLRLAKTRTTRRSELATLAPAVQPISTVQQQVTENMDEKLFHRQLTKQKKEMNVSVKKLLAAGGTYSLVQRHINS